MPERLLGTYQDDGYIRMSRTDTQAVHRREDEPTRKQRTRHRHAADRRAVRQSVQLGTLTEGGVFKMREGLR